QDGVVSPAGGMIDGQPVTAAFSHVPVSGWTVWASAPAAIADTALRRSAALVLGLGALLAALSAGLAVIFAGRIARPVMALARAAERLRQGETIEPPETEVSELAQVGHALAAAANA